MPNKIKDLLELYKEEIDKLGREHLVKIILYGSYARGDFRQDSDIDIMILVNDLDDSLVEYENKVDDPLLIHILVKHICVFPIFKLVYIFYNWHNFCSIFTIKIIG